MTDRLQRSGGPVGWQPIETAPKDVVMLYFPEIKTDRYGHRGQAAMLRIDHANSPIPFRQPTHWMPLPDPPGPDKPADDRKGCGRAAVSGAAPTIKQLTPAEYDASFWLHLYGQYAWHDDAKIVGNREALTALRDAIDKALADKNGEAELEAIAGDGEGYRVVIRRVPRSFVQRMSVPYTADYARAHR